MPRQINVLHLNKLDENPNFRKS